LVHDFTSFNFTPYQWLLAIVAAICLGMSKTAISGINLLAMPETVPDFLRRFIVIA